MTGLTAKGAATRQRIVHAANELILARGVGGMTLDEIRAGTATSKSQLFHYFPGGKGELVGAIAAYQNARVLQAQRPWLDHLDTWESWRAWRAATLAYYRTQTRCHCSISALANEVAQTDPELAYEIAALADRWRAYLEAGLRRMRARGMLRADADPDRLAVAVFAALQGGLVIMQNENSIEPLAAALDGALLMLRGAARYPSR